MSAYDYNLNNSFDFYNNTMSVQRPAKKKYNINTMTLPKREKSPPIYDIGVDNYVINEIKKAKYQGIFDPGSFGNKNIFLDSTRANNRNSIRNNQQKMNKNSIHYNRGGEGKNLLILKSEIQYPLTYGYNNVNEESNYNIGQGKNVYNFNNYYIESKNNNYRNIFARSNENKRIYVSPINSKEKKKDAQRKNFQTKTINIEKLKKDYDKKFNTNKMTLYEKYSTNTISFENPIKNYSPTFAPSRNQNYIKHRNIKNTTYIKDINDINKDESENINNTYNFDNDNYFDRYIHDNNDNDYYKTLDNNENEDIKLIKGYRKKLLHLFFWHIKTFYKLHFKSIFKEIINTIKNHVYNKEYNFEKKTIKNIAMLKKELKNNSYYYGYNGQYNNILKEVNIKNNIKNVIFDEDINDNQLINESPKFPETDINNSDKKQRQIYNRNIISKQPIPNKKIFIGNKNNLLKANNKYIKKKIPQYPQGVYGKKVVPQNKFNKTKLPDSNEKVIENKINNENDINQKIDKTPIIQKTLRFPKSALKDNKIMNSGVKIIDNHLNNIEKENEYIKPYDQDNLDRNNDNIPIDNDKIEQTKIDYKIDKNEEYIINKQKEENDYNDEINNDENDIKNNSNINLENEINIITKVIETKEKEDKQKKIDHLNKIIYSKINRDKKEHTEIMKKYFDKFKQTKNEILQEKDNLRKKLELKYDLIKKIKINKNKKLNKNLFLSDFEDNNEKSDLNIENNGYKSNDDNKNKKNKDKFRLVMKQIKIKKNNIASNLQNDNYRSKTPLKENKNTFIEPNNKTPKIIIKKTINIIFNKDKENKIQPQNENKKEIDIVENKLDVEKINDNDVDKNIMESNEENHENNLKINLEMNHSNNFSIEDKNKILEDKLDKDFSIETFSKFRKSRIKFYENEDENINNDEDITLTEKYQDCENFIYFLRTQLIFCFLSNKNYDHSFDD